MVRFKNILKPNIDNIDTVRLYRGKRPPSVTRVNLMTVLSTTINQALLSSFLHLGASRERNMINSLFQMGKPASERLSNIPRATQLVTQPSVKLTVAQTQNLSS